MVTPVLREIEILLHDVKIVERNSTIGNDGTIQRRPMKIGTRWVLYFESI